MNLDFSPEERLFRAEVRNWLHDNIPSAKRPGTGWAMREFDLAWQRTQYDGGWAGIAWPAEYGGRGLSLVEQMIWYEEYARADAPTSMGTTFVGNSHAGPTLINRASAEHKAFHLPRILKGEVAWCQGFSEPGAGSDLASLRTRAVIDGDHLVVNGQKIWTSYADTADYQELLVRTDPDSAKHRGISWVICDMKSPGITIRPIMSISGEAHFCEVFYDDVRIPLRNVVGEVNDGWSVAMATLSFERGTAFMADQVAGARRLERLIELAKTVKGPDGRRAAIEDEHHGRQLAMLRAELTALHSMTLAIVSRNLRQSSPGAEGSMVKLYFTEVEQRMQQLAMDILGNAGLQHSDDATSWSHHYLHSYASTIGGGTSEIQRNIIGERVLGLPRSK